MTALPDLNPDAVLARAALLSTKRADRRDADASTRSHGATPPTRPSPPLLAGPGTPVRAGQDPAPRTAPPPTRHPRHPAVPAPTPNHQEMDLPEDLPEPARPPAHRQQAP